MFLGLSNGIKIVLYYDYMELSPDDVWFTLISTVNGRWRVRPIVNSIIFINTLYQTNKLNSFQKCFKYIFVLLIQFSICNLNAIDYTRCSFTGMFRSLFAFYIHIFIIAVLLKQLNINTQFWAIRPTSILFLTSRFTNTYVWHLQKLLSGWRWAN